MAIIPLRKSIFMNIPLYHFKESEGALIMYQAKECISAQLMIKQFYSSEENGTEGVHRIHVEICKKVLDLSP